MRADAERMAEERAKELGLDANTASDGTPTEGTQNTSNNAETDEKKGGTA